MYMVGHKYIGMNTTQVSLTGVLQAVQKKLVVLVLKENRTAVIAALNEMVRLTRQHRTGWTGHGLSILLDLLRVIACCNYVILVAIINRL